MQSIDQIGNRADRLNITMPDIFLYSSTDIEVKIFNVKKRGSDLLGSIIFLPPVWYDHGGPVIVICNFV